ncbi:MAG: biotin/lipoyl-containing protein, partial [Alteripontixanthobacter sp.]
MTQDVKVPTLGESVTEATVGEWLKQPGDAVAMDEPIVSLETDKVAVEVPSPVAGVLGKLTVEIGDTVEVGAVIATIEEGGAPAGGGEEAGRAKQQREEGKEQRAEAGGESASGGDDSTGDAGNQTLSPAVRRAVLEHGVDPSTIKGTGKDGRLTKEDVLAAAKAKRDGGTLDKAAPEQA